MSKIATGKAAEMSPETYLNLNLPLKRSLNQQFSINSAPHRAIRSTSRGCPEVNCRRDAQTRF